jgi:hypothetical protein
MKLSGGMRSAVAAMLFAVLCGCATPAKRDTGQFASSADKWVGHTVDELIVAIGEPVGVSRIDSGGRVFRYLRDSTSGSNEARAIKKNQGGKTQGGKASGQLCYIRFHISSADIVESWSPEGDQCK